MMKSNLYGYVRVSTKEQNEARQVVFMPTLVHVYRRPLQEAVLQTRKI